MVRTGFMKYLGFVYVDLRRNSYYYYHNLKFLPKMVILSENRKSIICFHQNGVNSKDIIALQGLANVRTVQRIIKSRKETGSSSAKKGGGRPKVSNVREDRHLIVTS